MNYGRIRRGPMAADAFTQIRNTLFRDPRLSFKDKGVFGLISTHRDGFGVSAEAIAACSTDGVSAVKVALRNLERYGYLQRTQQRGEGGRLGGSVYFITDQPEAFEDPAELENPRSAPSVDFPSTAEPPAVGPSTAEPLAAEPPAENHPHKNTNSKHTSRKKTLPLPSQQSADVDAAQRDERETSSSGEAEGVLAGYVAAIGRPVSPTVAAKLTAQAASLLAAGFPAWWLTERATELAAHGWTDLAQHCDRSTAPTIRKPTESKADWCGTCQGPNNRLRKDPARDFELVECDTCHPAAVARQRRDQSGAAA